MHSQIELLNEIDVNTPTPELQIVEGQISTTSNQVAQHFGRQHKLVLRAIRNLLKELPTEYGCNFVPIQINVDCGIGRTRQVSAYRINRDGFTSAREASGSTPRLPAHRVITFMVLLRAAQAICERLR